MSWFNILSSVLKIAGIILDYLRDRRLLDEAKKQILADQLLELTKKAEAAREVKERVDKLSDADVAKRLSDRGDFRD